MRCYSQIVVFWGLVSYVALPQCCFSQDSQHPAKHSATDGTVVDGVDKAGPAQEIQFEVSTGPEKMRLFRADPKLLEQKYVASIYLSAFSPMNNRNEQGLLLSYQEPLGSVTDYGDTSVLWAGTRRNFGRRVQPGPDYFRSLMDRLPADAGVPQEAAQFFLSTDVSEGYVRFSNTPQFGGRGGRGPEERANDTYIQFRILAPSKEAAKERAAALVAMLEYGVAAPLRRALREAQADVERAIKKREAEVEQAKQAQMELAEKLNAAADIDAAELSPLKTQRRLLDVDLTGLRARIEAAEKLLARFRERNPSEDHKSRINKLEEIKIAAEIDIAGLAARREMLDALIKLGMQRAELESKAAQSELDASKTERRLTGEERTLGQFRSAIEAADQLYSLRDGKVLITPIEWTE